MSFTFNAWALEGAFPKTTVTTDISDIWRNNVELVIAQQIGTETTTYVRNIYKYYVAYRLTLDAKEEAAKARLQVAPAKS